MNVQDFLSGKETATTQEALKFFDAVPPLAANSMSGLWIGQDVLTNHPWDGLLETLGWCGKYFFKNEGGKIVAHPLLFYGRKNEIFSIKPREILLSTLGSFNIPRHESLKYLMRLARPFMQTNNSQATVEVIKYRGVYSAAMAYNGMKITDHFREITPDRVLSVMEMKGRSPYFFTLQKADSSQFNLSFL